jgi:hypothetical protein
LFGSSITEQSTYSSSDYGEIDLREEFDQLIYGDENELRHGHLVVVRHLRRDASGAPIDCSCRTEIARESEVDCAYCQGEGYLWDEQWYMAYSQYTGADGGLANRGKWMPPGEIRVDFKIFYFRYDTQIRYGDKIVEMKLDDEGAVVVPYIRESIYKPQTINRYRSDNGRVEYIAAYCREQDAIRSDTPQ